MKARAVWAWQFPLLCCHMWRLLEEMDSESLPGVSQVPACVSQKPSSISFSGKGRCSPFAERDSKSKANVFSESDSPSGGGT